MWVKATRIVVTLMVGRRLCCFAVRYKNGVSWVAVAHRSPLSPTYTNTETNENIVVTSGGLINYIDSQLNTRRRAQIKSYARSSYLRPLGILYMVWAVFYITSENY